MPPPAHSKLAPQVLIITLEAEENYLFPLILRQHYFKNLFPPTVERGGGNYDLLYQTSIRKYDDDGTLWNIRLFIIYMICNFFKCDRFTVL